MVSRASLASQYYMIVRQCVLVGISQGPKSCRDRLAKKDPLKHGSASAGCRRLLLEQDHQEALCCGDLLPVNMGNRAQVEYQSYHGSCAFRGSQCWSAGFCLLTLLCHFCFVHSALSTLLCTPCSAAWGLARSAQASCRAGSKQQSGCELPIGMWCKARHAHALPAHCCTA